VVRGGAARDSYFLKIAHTQDVRMRLYQRLEHIRNGAYELTAQARNTGGHEVAALWVNGRALHIPAAESWTPIRLGPIAVTNHTAVVQLAVVGGPESALCLDDIQFKKPMPEGVPEPPPRPFTLVRDPIWQIAMTEPIDFNGDATFFFIDRNVGFGDAMTLSMELTPRIMATMSPVARTPAKGKHGWAVVLGDRGQIAFRIGSKADCTEVIAPDAYSPGRPVRLKCVYDRGAASIFIDGRKAAEKTGIAQGVKDRTKAGTFGAVDTGFEAVGEVIGGEARKAKGRSRNYVGRVFDLRIYNRVAD
jgi:hypothetical protein